MTRSTHLPPAARRVAEQEARAAAIRRWEQRRAGGRSHFIWRSGVVGWGLPAALLTGFYKVFQEQGLAWPHDLSPHLRVALGLIGVACPVLGYILGAWLWDQGEANHARLIRERDGG